MKKLILFGMIILMIGLAYANPTNTTIEIENLFNTTSNGYVSGVYSGNLSVFSASSGGTLWYNQNFTGLNITSGTAIIVMNQSKSSIDFNNTPYIEFCINGECLARKEWGDVGYVSQANNSWFLEGYTAAQLLDDTDTDTFNSTEQMINAVNNTGDYNFTGTFWYDGTLLTADTNITDTDTFNTTQQMIDAVNNTFLTIDCDYINFSGTIGSSGICDGADADTGGSGNTTQDMRNAINDSTIGYTFSTLFLSGGWGNVSITDDQISNLSYTTDTDTNCTTANSCSDIIYEAELDALSELNTQITDATFYNFSSVTANKWCQYDGADITCNVNPVSDSNISDTDTFNSTEEMQDAVGSALGEGIGISMIYTDADNTINASFDCSDVISSDYCGAGETLNTDGAGACASGSLCGGGHTHPQYLQNNTGEYLINLTEMSIRNTDTHVWRFTVNSTGSLRIEKE